MNNPEIFVDACHWNRQFDLRVKIASQGTVNVWMKESVNVNVQVGDTPPVAFHLDTIEAQALIDRLWKAGLRPTEGSGSAGSLAATERHLKDMQRLVFD